MAVALSAVGLAQPSLAQEENVPPPSRPAAAEASASFNIDIRAPRSVRPLLERHLELQRYREVADLDDAELSRLIVLAERNVRELVGTLGYFDPQIAIRREPGADGQRPVIVVEVEPGALTQVADVKMEFEGEIVQASELDAIAQREQIESGWRLPAGHTFTQEAWEAAKTSA